MSEDMGAKLVELYKAGQRDFRHWDLRGIRVHGASLEEVDFSWALLRQADLSWCNLRYAVLRGADLRQANLARCELANADLICADLEGADLSGAGVKDADFAYANLDRATLGDLPLEPSQRRGMAATFEQEIGTHIRQEMGEGD